MKISLSTLKVPVVLHDFVADSDERHASAFMGATDNFKGQHTIAVEGFGKRVFKVETAPERDTRHRVRIFAVIGTERIRIGSGRVEPVGPITLNSIIVCNAAGSVQAFAANSLLAGSLVPSNNHRYDMFLRPSAPQ